MELTFTREEMNRILATPMEKFENADMMEDAFNCIQKGFSIRNTAQYIGKKYHMKAEDTENLWYQRSSFLELFMLLIAYEGED